LNIAIKNSSLNENTLIWAVVCSILLHFVFFVAVPNFKFDVIKKMPDVLKVVLVQPKKPAPVAKVIEPIKPEPKIPEPIKPKEIQPKPIKPEPIKKIIEPKPAQKVAQAKPEASPEAKPEPIQAEPQVPVVIAATPKMDEKPAFVAPTPQPEAVTEEDIGTARNAYIKSVHQELKRNHRYPKMAERNGISGEVRVEIKFDKEGNVVSSSVIESSGNASLDEGALATVSRSNFRQYMKKILVGHIDTIIVPIVFTLASN
jgi:periplasmic protein TonB